MLHTSKLRSGSRNGFTRALKSALASVALLILLPLAASAYTVILHNGRSVEIPDGFSLTRAGITYEYASGLYVTIQMTSIDIAATERANREPAGTLLSRAGRNRVGKAAASASSSGSVSARRTLTDRELEAARARREAAEAAYERRRVELGLPSVEESRRQREEETRRLSEMAAESEIKEAQSESYWRSRASELRAAIAVNDAEINYVRSRLGVAQGYYPTVSFTSITPFPFVVPVGRPVGSFSTLELPPVPMRTPRPPRRPDGRAAPLGGRFNFGAGATRGRISLNPAGAYTGFQRPRPFGTRGFTTLPQPYYVPYAYNNTYDQSVLATRLPELEAERAGLQARWRLLEEEARRAGVPPGWLRP
jgi:hypothetical protein